jgi:hypothetical protein
MSTWKEDNGRGEDRDAAAAVPSIHLGAVVRSVGSLHPVVSKLWDEDSAPTVDWEAYVSLETHTQKLPDDSSAWRNHCFLPWPPWPRETTPQACLGCLLFPQRLPNTEVAAAVRDIAWCVWETEDHSQNNDSGCEEEEEAPPPVLEYVLVAAEDAFLARAWNPALDLPRASGACMDEKEPAHVVTCHMADSRQGPHAHASAEEEEEDPHCSNGGSKETVGFSFPESY